MFCQQCGLKLPDGAKFCGVCGTPVQSEPSPPQNNWTTQSQVRQYDGTQPYPVVVQPQKKKGVSKGAISAVVISSILAVAIICAGVYAVVGGLKNRIPNTTSASVNFDLTQYQAHGELSCGLIWVERTASSYNQSPETQFAYFDTNGNQKSEWFYSSTWTKADFSNGLLCLCEAKLNVGASNSTTLRSHVECVVYDTSFTKIASIWCAINEGITITDADENGNLFAFGEYGNDDRLGLYVINSSGIKRFDIDSNNLTYDTLKNLERIKTENGYYVVDLRGTLGPLGNLPSYYGIFDQQCNAIFEPSETIPYDVYSVKILSENEFNVHFKGRDNKYYWVKTNSKGEFLEEPHESE